MDWLSHGQRANQYNASLTSIHSQAEMNLMINMIQNISSTDIYYVGGSRQGIAGDPWTDGTSSFWKWTDKTPWDFTLWASDEPNGQSIGNNIQESVVVLRNSEMRDTFSTLNYPAVYRRHHNYPQIMELPNTLGAYYTCALKNKKNVNCWGRNNVGQLGDGTTTSRSIPTSINVGNGRTVTQLALGLHHSCAVLNGGDIKCWGWNNDGQLGDGTTTSRSLPTSINVGNGRTVTQLALGRYHSCAVLNGGDIKCWGNNSSGHLGDGTTTSRSIPTSINVGNGRTVTQLALGWCHSCALLDGGDIKCWGRNVDGQLGDGTTTSRSLPTSVNVGNGRTVTQLALGWYHSCALLDGGDIKCWGRNTHGQLGDGTTTSRSLPTSSNVGNGRTVTQLARGGYHSCALLNGGNIMCWGRNTHGQLGDGTTNDQRNATLAYSLLF